MMVRSGWKKFIGQLRQTNNMLASQLAMAEVREVNDNQITAVFDPSSGVARQVVEKPNNLAQIKTALADFFTANLSIIFETDKTKKDDDPAHDKKKSKSIDLKKLVAESPRLKMLIEKVDGEIIGVRNSE